MDEKVNRLFYLVTWFKIHKSWKTPRNFCASKLPITWLEPSNTRFKTQRTKRNESQKNATQRIKFQFVQVKCASKNALLAEFFANNKTFRHLATMSPNAYFLSTI